MTDQKIDSTMKLTLHKFGSLACAPCVYMKKKRILEQFGEKHPNVTVKQHECSDANWETPKGTAFADAEKLSKRRKIKALPTLIFDDEQGQEIIRFEGALATLKDMEMFYLDALRAAMEASRNEDEDEEDEDEEDDTEGEEKQHRADPGAGGGRDRSARQCQEPVSDHTHANREGADQRSCASAQTAGGDVHPHSGGRGGEKEARHR